MTTRYEPNADWMSTQEKVLTMTDNQLRNEFPVVMRARGFSESDIHRALKIVAEFRDRHKMPVID